MVDKILSLINRTRDKLNGLNKGVINKFFYSDIYLGILCLFVFVSWIIEMPALGFVSIIILTSITLIVHDDLSVEIPVVLFIPLVIKGGNINPADYVPLIPVFIPLVISIVFHLIVYKPSHFTKGKFFWAQIGIAIAMIMGGAFSVSGETYLKGLLMVVLMGPVMLLIYWLWNNYIKNSQADIGLYFAKCMTWFAILIMLQIFVFYSENNFEILNFRLHYEMNLGVLVSNSAAQVLLFCAPFAFYLSTKYKKIGSLFLVLGTLEFLFMFFTYSRGAILFSFIVAPLCYVFSIWKSNNKKQTIITLSLILIALLTVYFVNMSSINNMIHNVVTKGADTFANAKNLSSNRIDLWKEAWIAFLANPVFGSSLGFFGNIFKPEALSFYWFHNTFFQIVGDMGIFGLIMYSWNYVVKIKIYGRDFKKSSIKCAILLSFIAFELHSLVETAVFVPMPMMSTMMLMLAVAEHLNSEECEKYTYNNLPIGEHVEKELDPHRFA